MADVKAKIVQIVCAIILLLPQLLKAGKLDKPKNYKNRAIISKILPKNYSDIWLSSTVSHIAEVVQPSQAIMLNFDKHDITNKSFGNLLFQELSKRMPTIQLDADFNYNRIGNRRLVAIWAKSSIIVFAMNKNKNYLKFRNSIMSRMDVVVAMTSSLPMPKVLMIILGENDGNSLQSHV